MKHSRSLAVVLASGLIATSAANAQDMYKSGVGGVYTGLNYTFMSLDAGGEDADVGTLSAKAGVMATPFLGFEARGGFGVDDDRVRGIDFSVDNFFGGYATFNIANESPVTPYVVLGFTRVEVEAEGPFNTVTDDDSDVSYGVGLNMEFARNVSGNLEYMRYYDDDDVTVDGLGVGVQFNF